MKKFTLVLITLLTLLPMGVWGEETTIDGVTYEYSGTTASVKSVATSATSATILSSFQVSETTYTVTAIANNAFNNCTVLGTLTFEGNTVGLLNNTTFGAANASMIIISNNIKYKHNGTWNSGDNFIVTGYVSNSPTDYTVIESINNIDVTEIGKKAFANLSSKNVHISKKVINISNEAFIYLTNGALDNANNLNSITVDAENPKYKSHNGVLYLYDNTAGTLELISCPTSKSGTNFWAEGVTAIGTNAFMFHRNLSTIMIPATVKTIGQSAFQYAGQDVSEGLTLTFANGSQMTEIGQSAFRYSGVKEILLPEGLTKIGESAFYGCTKLTSVTMPTSLTTMGGSAFSGCNLLSSVTFPPTTALKVIPTNAFYDCLLTPTIEIPNSITTINSKAFNHGTFNPALTTVRIPSSVTSIADDAFPNTVTKQYKLNLTFDEGKEWATYYSLENLALPTNLKAYTITSVGDNSIEIDDLHYIHKGKAILLQHTDNNEIELWCGAPTYEQTSADINKTFASEFKGSTEGITNFTSIAGDKYVLSGYKFVKTNQGSLPAFRCYIVRPNANDPTDHLYFKNDGVNSNHTFLYKEDGKFLNNKNYDETIGKATLSPTTDGKMELTITPGANYYAYYDDENFNDSTKSDITVRRNVTAVSGRAAPIGLDNTFYKLTPGEDSSQDKRGAIVYTFDPGEATVFEVTVNFHERTNFSETSATRVVTLSENSYEYDGTAKTPTVTQVTYNGTVVDSENYTVSYLNNTNAKEATVIITGRRKFRNTYSDCKFSISKRDINKVTVSTIPDQTYTGSAITPELTITDVNGENSIISTNDYTIQYSNNTNVTTTSQKARVSIVSNNAGNYQSTKVVEFNIVPKAMTANDIPNIINQTYTGNAIEPKPAITYNNKTLDEGTDYDVTYENNINSGVATAIYTFKGNYSGTNIRKDFVISDHPQTISVNFENPDNQWTTYYSKENLKLVEGLKAYVVIDIDGMNVNTQEVTFIPANTAVLLYSENGEKSFNLQTDYAASLPDGTTPNTNIFKGTTKALNIANVTGGKTFVLINGKFVQTTEGTLGANRCYIVADIEGVATLTIGKATDAIIYTENGTENNNIGTASTTTAAGTATLTVKPNVGYYVEKNDLKIVRSTKAVNGRAMSVDGGVVEVTAGGIIEKSDYSSEYEFTYQRESGYDYQITVNFHPSIDLTKAGEQPTIAFTNPTYNGSEQKVEPTVTTYDGNKLTKDIDYVLIYPDEDYTKAGKNKKFTVQGIRKYRKSLDKTFNIEKRNINMVTFSAKEGQTWIEGHTLSDPEPHQVVFTGAPIELNIADVVNDKNILTDDEATITYADDITNAGNTSVSVKSKGVNYQGEKTFNYTIVAKQMTADDIAEIPKQDYTGSEIKPSLSITYGKIPLKEGTDYEVTYSKNINAGEATATVTFKGNYTGKVDKTFTIDEAKETLTINFDDKNEWTTYYSDKNLNVADGFKTYVVIGLDGKKVVPHEIDFIPKEVPVLLNRTGDKTSFKVTTCSTKEMDPEIKPWDYFKGAKSDMTFSESAGVTRFVLFNNQFVQTKTGTLEKGRCYIEVTDEIPGVTTLAIGKGVSAIICMEEGTETTAVGSATVSSQPDKDNNMTLTINPKSGFYADKKDIKMVYSTDAGKSRAPEIGSGEITLTPVEGYNDTGKEYKYTFPYTEGYYYQITVNFHKCINFLTKETQPVITLEDGTYVYDGTVKKPKIASVKITFDGDVRDLKENKDFTIKYGDNNVNAGGNAQVIITGMNHYTSEFSKKFTISQRNIKNDNIKVDAIADQIYTGSAIEPTAVVVKDIVKIDGKDVELLNRIDRIEDKPDYTLEYLNNTHVGTATVNIIANNINYTGVKTAAATFNILPKDLSAEGNQPTIEPIPVQIYDGKEKKPELVIKDGSLTIDPSNYDVKYSNNIVEGTAKADVTFTGDYKGTASTTFEITYKKERKKLNVEFGENDEWTTYYSPIDLQEVEGVDIFVVTGRNPENPIDLKTEKIEFIPKNIGVLLQRTDKTKTEFYGQTMASTTKLEGVTPDTDLFRGSVAGIADIKAIEGIKYFLKNDNFIQVVEGALPANRCYVFISNENAEKEDITHVEGNDADGIVIQEEGESSKTAGTVNVSDVSTDGYKTITVTPASVNYATKDEIKVVRSIKNETPAASASHRVPSIENTTVEVEPEVEHADPSGTTTYKFKYDANYHYQVTVNFQNRINLSKTAEYNPVVTLKAEDIQDLVYDGKEKKPDVVSVKCNGTVVDPSNYDITYENNTNAGKPRVIITGKRFLMGSTHAEFSIGKRDFSNVTVELPIPDQEYTGSTIIPTNIVVKDIVDGQNIVSYNDFSLICENNIEVGTAKVSLAPKNNYYGVNKDYTFKIIPATGIQQINLDEVEGMWYNLNGQYIQKRPTQKGVYILRNKKGKTKKVRIK